MPDQYDVVLQGPQAEAPETPIPDARTVEGFRREHRGRADAYGDQFESVMRQRASKVEEAKRLLDETTATLREKHEGAGAGQMNLPMLAMAAGLLSPGAPGRASNFGEELSRGLTGMGTTIARQRMNDADFHRGIADLQIKRASLEQEPLKDQAAYLKAAQLAEDKHATEAERMLSLARTAGQRLDKPMPMPDGAMFMPNAFGPGRHGKIPAGSDKLVPISLPGAKPGGGAEGAKTPEIPTDPEGLKNYLVDQVGPSVVDDSRVAPIKLDKLAEVIATDPENGPERASLLMSVINHEQDPDKIYGKRPGGMAMAARLKADAKKIDPTYDYTKFKQVQDAKQEWETKGVQSRSIAQLNKTIAHFGDGFAALAALDNKDIRLFNAIRNKIAKETQAKPGDRGADVSGAKAVATILVPEIAKYLAGPGGTSGVGEREEQLNNLFSTNATPAQAQKALRNALKMVTDQANTQAEAKTVAFGNTRKYKLEHLLGDTAKHVYGVVAENDMTTPEGRAEIMKLLPPGIGKMDPLVGGHGAAPTPAGGTKSWPTPNEAARKRLHDNPTERGLFDEHFGPGAAKRVLGN